MIGIHVLQDAGSRIRQRVWLRLAILLRGDPSHHAEAADVVHIDHVHSEEGEIVEIHPVLAVFVAFQIEPACFRHLGRSDH